MKVKCDYCDALYEDTLDKCPSCGAPNPIQVKDAGKPKTINELRDWYERMNLPPEEVTRFFVGKNISEPKAFGIYFDESTGNYVVYKNKASGERAVRYKGKNEAYAVSELWLRLKEEIVHQKLGNPKSASIQAIHKEAASQITKEEKKGTFFLVAFIVGTWILFLSLFFSIFCGIPSLLTKHNGYYLYNGQTYYKNGSNWYSYDDDFDLDTDFSDDNYGWSEVPKKDPDVAIIAEHYDDYYVSDQWNSSISSTNWDDTEYYEEYHSSSDSGSDSSSDYSWDSSSDWDSGSTDWDSDW